MTTQSTGTGPLLPACDTDRAAGAPDGAARQRLIDRRDALPRGSRKRAALDHRIREITHAMMRAAQ